MNSFIRFLFLLVFTPAHAWAQTAGSEGTLQPYVENVQQAGQGMTLMQILYSGGIVMAILGVLSLVLIGIVFFLSLQLNRRRIAPDDLADNVVEDFKQHKTQGVRALCESTDTLFSTIVLSGLDCVESDRKAAGEALQVSARQEVSGLWASLNYISDIAQVAPMLGLLGTVLGMIQAFNTIAFDSAVVKPILLAGGVSKAMITTAGGLAIAILATVLYTMLRPRVQAMTHLLELRVSQVLEAMES